MSTIRAQLPAITLRRGPEAAAVVQVVARVAIAVGLLLAGFLAYQFGVTSVVAHQAQDGLRSQLADSAADRVTATPYRPAALPAAPIAVPADLPPPEPARPAAATGTAVAGRAPTLLVESSPPPRTAVGRLLIPAAGVDWMFVEGVDTAALRSGAGHMPGTALPGQPGNAVISGHRTTYGAPFLHLDRLVPGDPITVETAAGTHIYQVVDTRIVSPGDVWVTGQWDGAWLTLTTCHPVFSSRERLVVIARLVAGPNAAVILGMP